MIIFWVCPDIMPFIAATPVFYWFGVKAKELRDRNKAENNAALKVTSLYSVYFEVVHFYSLLFLFHFQHYIMTNPELFPEPKRVKYIDYIQDWRKCRY